VYVCVYARVCVRSNKSSKKDTPGLDLVRACVRVCMYACMCVCIHETRLIHSIYERVMSRIRMSYVQHESRLVSEGVIFRV